MFIYCKCLLTRIFNRIAVFPKSCGIILKQCSECIRDLFTDFFLYEESKLTSSICFLEPYILDFNRKNIC